MSHLVRRLVLAFTLIAGLVPVMAASPPAVPALPDTERRTTYTITASTCACAVGFALYGDGTDYGDWIEVFVNEVLQSPSTYTVTSPTGTLGLIPLPITDAVVTFDTPQTGTVQIVGARRPRRLAQFSENRGVAARDLNVALTDLVAQNRETWDKLNDVTGRAILAPPGETLNLLPAAANRENLGACFDNNGNLVSCTSVPTSTFSAGDGITFSGTNPTTIKNNVSAVVQGGVGTYLTGSGTVASPLTVNAAMNGTTSVTGASTTYASSQAGELVLRSNSGSPMEDTLPGTSPGVLPIRTTITITNNDTGGILSIKAGSGAAIKSVTASTGYIYLCPGQSVTVYSDGSNYWAQGTPVRCKLQASTTIYIATTGSSSNDGLTASTPLPDINTAYGLAQSILDVNYKSLTFSVASGTYPAVLLNGPLLGVNANPTNGSNVTFLGNAAIPTNVVISTSTASNAWLMTNGAVGLVNGFSLSNSTGHNFAADEGAVALVENITFSQTGVHENHITSSNAALVFIVGNMTVLSNGGCEWITAAGGQISTFDLSGTITYTLTGTPSYATAFACAQYPSIIIINTAITFSGSATGPRYSAFLNGVINSGGGGASFFPGNTAGTTSTGGQYQ